MRIPRPSLTVLVTCMVLACCLVSSAPALAGEATVFSGLSFGPAGPDTGSFAGVRGVAIDQAGGDVYVYDAVAGTVYKFDAAGEPVSFASSGTNVIEGVGGGGIGESEIAVDSSTGPAKGDVYVANNSSVLIYNGETGEKLGELTGGEACGVAVDPSGDVYVGFYPHISEFTPLTNPVTDAEMTGTATASNPELLEKTCNVAADGSGNVYAAAFHGGITKLEGLSASEGIVLDPQGNTPTIDPANNDVYVDEGGDIAEYDPAGALLERFSGSGAGVFSASEGVAVNDTTGDEYVGDGGSMKVFESLTLPDVTTGAATEATPSSATLTGTVNAEGTSGVTYSFEYGFDTSYGLGATASVPVSGSTSQPVRVPLGNLKPNTTYHYRLVASNATLRPPQTVSGEDHTFTTPPTPPTAVTGGNTSVTLTSALITGAAGTQELAGTYAFELGTSPESLQAVAFGALAPVSGGQSEGLTLTGLASGTTYYYRFTASTTNGSSQGSVGSFTTVALSSPLVTATQTFPNLTSYAPLPAPRQVKPSLPKKKAKGKHHRSKPKKQRKKGKSRPKK